MKLFLALLFGFQTAYCADYLTGQAARAVIGQQNFTALETTQPPNSGILLGGAAGIAYANNMLFIADGNEVSAPSDNRVLIYTPVSSFPTPTKVPTPQQNQLFALTCPVCIGNPAVVLGQPTFTTYNQNLTQNGIRNATAVASDGKILVVADTDNNRVLIWNTIPASVNQNADVVLGQADFTHGAAVLPPTASSMRGPQGVWLAGGKLYVADTLDNRILIFNSIPTANNAAADVVLGQPNFTTYVTPPVTQQTVTPTQSNLASPTSVTTDATHLYVSDLGNNRILIWNTIPTANNAPASLELGQADFVSNVDNNNTGLCPSNGTDTTVTPNVPTYPDICGETLSFPRFALSDGTRLYVADGGNDRVLVYDTIPTANHTEPDHILGEPDENTDASSSNADSMATPSSLAWDGTNLYVADTYNLRVLIFTPLGSNIPLTGVRNAASLEIFATGDVSVTGTPAAKDTVTITIGTTNYTYTVLSTDTLATIVTGLTALINGQVSGTAADPNAIAVADLVNPAVLLTARIGGDAGSGTALAASVSSSGLVATVVLPAGAAGSAILINQASSVQIAPGTLISIFGSNFTSQTAAYDYSSPNLPRSLGGATVYIDGLQAPLLYVSPTQINAQMPYETYDRNSVSVYEVNSSGPTPVATNAIGTVIVPENPGLFAAYGDDPRPGYVNHLTANSAALVSIDGTVNEASDGTVDTSSVGETVSVTITGTLNGAAYSQTYTYTIVAADTTTTNVRDDLVALIANDPLVTATPTNTFSRLVLESRIPGTAGNGIGVSVTTSTGATVTLTALTQGGFLCCGNSGNAQVTLANPAAPGELLYTYATGLGETEAPSTDSNTGRWASGTLYPPATPVDSIVAGNVTAYIVDANLVPGTVGLFQVVFQLGATVPADNLTQLTIAQDVYVSNVVTFPVAIPTN